MPCIIRGRSCKQSQPVRMMHRFNNANVCAWSSVRRASEPSTCAAQKTCFAYLSRFPLRSPLHSLLPRIPFPSNVSIFISPAVFLSLLLCVLAAVKLRHVEIMIIARWAQKSHCNRNALNVINPSFTWERKLNYKKNWKGRGDRKEGRENTFFSFSCIIRELVSI